MNPFYYSRRFFTKKQIKKIVLVLIISIVGQSFLFTSSPFVSEAKAKGVDITINPDLVASTTTATPAITISSTTLSTFNFINLFKQKIEAVVVEEVKLPVVKQVVVSSATRRISAYNAGDVNQCDGDPCTAANGENICLALERGYKRCAANFVPFGTILEIEGYGQCLVVDRMNSRYPNNVDIAMKYEDKHEALEFGRRSLNVKIITQINTDSEIALK